MNTKVFISGTLRTAFGKKASADIRKKGEVPCVMYGGNESVHFSLHPLDLKNIIFTPDFNVIEIEISGVKHRCILKDYQLHPVTDEVTHVDFLKLVDGKKVKVEVPVRFKGVSPGVKGGGKLQQLVRRVKIKTTPSKLVDEIQMDISNLGLGQSIRIRDIAPMEGIEIMNSPGIPVATIEIPRAMRSAEAAKKKGEN